MARSTRFAVPNEPLQIYQDDFFEDSTPMISHAPMPSVTKAPRRPLGTSNRNVVLNPPSSSSAKYSPLKAASRSSTSPLGALKASGGNKLNMFSMAPPSSKNQNTDSLYKKQPYLSKFKTVAQKPTMDAGMSFGKENIHPQLFPAPPTINFDNYHFQKGPGKRSLMDAAQIDDSRSAKKIKMEESGLPPHDSFPKIADDGSKPGHSYATLIGMAILRSPNRRLTLAQIYKWISDTYKFYNAQDAGWQNSIRHNLSLHKAFIKIERPKDDPGKGNYWGIEPGMEQQFMKEKPSRKSASAAENLPVMSTRLEPSKPSSGAMQEPTLPPSAPMTSATLPALPTSQATMSMAAELSSDATIPNSDAAALEEALEKAMESEMPVDPSFYSPLPAAMHSSPPIPRHMEPRSKTPPPAVRVPVSSITRSHKRKFASMDDSGYISSLESSVMRPNQKSATLTSEADRPRVKRNRAGRAEEEIARLRASSYDSPSKGRSYNGFAPPSSSPMRQEGQMLPPLTPAVKFKAPPRPPPSVSPNTNLRIHRDRVRHMLQSPLRKMTGAGDENTPWSPAFNLDETVYFNELPVGGFDIFQDFDDSFFGGMETHESPTKRSTKRVRLDRSHSANALSDLTNSVSSKSVTSAGFLKVPNQSALFLDTPSKVFEGLSSPDKLYMQSPLRFPSPSKFSGLMEAPAEGDWPALTFDPADFLTEEVTEYSGLDILQGFEKIGSGSQPKQLHSTSKPPFGRSYSTTF